ncbi:MAG: ArsR/SmtB family transcription factor [Streptosporangiaceae bacterium]|jgi:DNA-binding transcriptional ArsR family regulator
MVTYSRGMGAGPQAHSSNGVPGSAARGRPADEDDRAFRALADPTRRLLLDLLFERGGRTLTELESRAEMTRFGVMKHLRVLTDAGLVVSRKSGRNRLHYLNPVPIRQIHDRWISKYAENAAAALADLKKQLEEQ